MYELAPARSFTDPHLEARCSEPGCGKTVREHIAECKALVATLGAKNERVKTRPAPCDPMLDRPAAMWTPEERVKRAHDMLEAFAQHLRARQAGTL